MKLTIFNAEKSYNKYPRSPYGNNVFVFETKEVSLDEIFDALCSNFVLNIPLNKNIKTRRLAVNLKPYYDKKLDYIILDIDDLDTISDRELAIKYFRDAGFRCILGESRTDYRLKGVLRTEPVTRYEAKNILKEIQKHVPGIVDLTSIGSGTYQAPILKHKILYNNGTKLYPKPVINKMPQLPGTITVPSNVEQLCINEFQKLGFSFNTPTQNNDGYQCSHYTERKTPNGFTFNRNYPFVMKHWNSDRNVSIWDTIIKTPEYKKYKKEKSKQEIIDLLPEMRKTTKSRYLDNSEETQELVKTFIQAKNDILKIQSPMGTGKSSVIEEILHQSRKNNLRVLFITNRISLADDIYNKYPNISHYLGTDIEENKYNIGDDLVVQIDSLHRYSVKYFDVVILDEAATTLMYLLTLENHKKNIITKMFSLYKKKLVLADAFLFNDMIDIFKTKDTGMIQIDNKYRDHIDLEFFKNKDQFIHCLIQSAKEKPITFSSGSIQILKIVEFLAKNENLSYVTISAETSKEQRQMIYRSMEFNKPAYDILMYSPSLTVGVSNENDIDNHYHYDTGNSMDVISSLQMTKRTRKIKKLSLYLKERIKYNSTNIFQIQSQLTDFIKQDDDGDLTSISETGIKLSKLINIRNTLENRHKVSFIELMKYQYKFMGYTHQNNTKHTPFVNKIQKLVQEQKLKDIKKYFKVFKDHLETPEGPSLLQDLAAMYPTNQEQRYIRQFYNEFIDTSLSHLSDLDRLSLIKENIETPVIDAYKLHYADLNIKKYPLVIPQKDIKNLKMEPVELGYKKNRYKYVLNPVIQRLIEPRV